MMLRDVPAGAIFELLDHPGEIYFVERRVDDDRRHVWCRKPTNPNATAYVPLSRPVRLVAISITDRCRGGDDPRGTRVPDRAGAMNALGSDPDPHRTPGPVTHQSHRLGSGSGVYVRVDTPPSIEDVLDHGLPEFVGILAAIGTVGWALGDFPLVQVLVGALISIGGFTAGWLIRRRARASLQRDVHSPRDSAPAGEGALDDQIVGALRASGRAGGREPMREGGARA